MGTERDFEQNFELICKEMKGANSYPCMCEPMCQAKTQLALQNFPYIISGIDIEAADSPNTSDLPRELSKKGCATFESKTSYKGFDFLPFDGTDESQVFGFH